MCCGHRKNVEVKREKQAVQFVGRRAALSPPSVIKPQAQTVAPKQKMQVKPIRQVLPKRQPAIIIVSGQRKCPLCKAALRPVSRRVAGKQQALLECQNPKCTYISRV